VFGKCQKIFWNRISLANRIEDADRKKDIDEAIPIVHLALVIILLMGVIFLEYWHEQYCTDINAKTISSGDYSLLFHGLPHGEEFRGVNLEKILFDEFRKKGYHLKTISFIFDT